MARGAVEVVLEVGGTRVFADAVGWPGWCRSARDEAGATGNLAAYASRYSVVAARAGVPFREPSGFEVVERLTGNATTDFGAPGVVATVDAEPLTAAEARRQVTLLRAAWGELDRVSREAPDELRKGPRGGGRDRDKIVAHVIGAERSYASKIGVRHAEPPPGDPAALTAMRADIAAALEAARSGEPMRDRGWPARYALRRMAWHVLDHVWEIEDRSTG